MTLCSSPSTRILIDRTLICNAILYHFQITLTCGRTNRLFIPLTLFLLSRPLEQLEFIRFSNFQQKYGSSISSSTSLYVPHGKCSHATSKVDIDDISSIQNFFFKSPARDDLLINFLVSVFTSYKNLRSVAFNLGRICWKQISSFFTIKLPHISLPDPPFLRSRRHSRHRSFSLSLARAVRWYIFDESFMYKNVNISHVIAEKKDV